MLRRGAGAGLRAAVLGDLPLFALLPALHAALLQERGLERLAEGATTTAAAERAGVRACEALTAGAFDLLASEAIDEGDVDMGVAPMDLCAGMLPLTQLGLHAWFRNCAYVESELAKAVDFVKNQVLDPHAGLAAFPPTWGAAPGEEDDIPSTDVYFALFYAALDLGPLPGCCQRGLRLRGRGRGLCDLGGLRSPSGSSVAGGR